MIKNEEVVLRKRSALNTKQIKTNEWINWCLDSETMKEINVLNLKQAFESIEFMSCLLFVEYDTCDQSSEEQMLIFKYDKNIKTIDLEIDPKQNVNGFYKMTIGKRCNESKRCLLRKILSFLGLILNTKRADRDNFIKVNESNIDPFYLKNFVIDNNADTANTSYDYGSIMQLSNFEFRNGMKRTFKIKPSHYEVMLGQGYGLSFTDIKLLNIRYCKASCIDNDMAKNVKCKNGGIINPYSCANCICPNMFAADKFCEKMDPSDSSCPSSEFNATSKKTKLVIKGKKRCNIKIIAKKGKKILITVKKAVLSAIYPCFEGLGLEVKYRKDKTLTGLILCVIPESVSIVSEDETVLLQYNGEQNNHIAIIEYQMK